MATIFDGITGIQIHHIAIQVPKGRLQTAADFFTFFGCTENRERRRSGDWGKSRFLETPHSLPIQLIESPRDHIFNPDESHVAFRVKDPKRVVEQVESWAEFRKQECDVEPFDTGTRMVYFVTMKTLLDLTLEFLT